MSRLYIKIAAPFIVFFIGLTLLTRAQPYDDGNVRALLIPNDCKAPCFMGIRPGVTSANEAIDMLESHPWVENIEAHDGGTGTPFVHVQGWVYWDWKTDAPVWFRGLSSLAGQHSGSLDTVDGVVVNITIATNISFGHLWLAVGKSTNYGLAFNLVATNNGMISKAVLRYRNANLQNDITLDSYTLCQASWNTWFQPSLISVVSAQESEARLIYFNNQPLLMVMNLLQGHVCNA